MLEYALYYFYFFIVCIFISKYISRLATVLLVFSPLCILLINRGDVGPDLPSYISIVEICLESFSRCIEITDPGFALSIQVLSGISSNPKEIINIFGVFQILIIAIASMQLGSAYKIFLMFYIPYFSLSYSFNSIRSGIALAFAVLATFLISKRSIISGAIFAFISVTFHYTYILFLVFCSIVNLKLVKRYFFYLFAIICIFVFLNYNLKYLFNSIYSNLNLQISSITLYSGLSPLILGLLTLRISHRNNFGLSNQYFFIFTALLIIFYIGVSYTYSALRLLELTYMAIIANYCIKYEKYGLSKKIPSGVIIVSAFSAIFRIRNFWADSYQSFSMAPFNWN